MITIKRIKIFFSCLAIVTMLFPYYQFKTHPDVFGWYIDFLIGNTLFALVIIFGGRWSLLFGGIIAFQRIFEILAVQIWGAYFVGITSRLVDDLFSNTLGEAIEYGTSLYKEIIAATIIVTLYLWVYYRLAKFLVSVMEKRRYGQKRWKQIVRFTLVALLLTLAWNKRAQTEVFFFESKYGDRLSYYLADNTMGYLTKTNVPEAKVDVYFIIGESVSKSNMSLYGYERKTTPYLDSLNSKTLTFWRDAIAPEGHTSASFKAMFSRKIYEDDATFFLSPNIVEELNHAGYKTVWASYRRMNKTVYAFPALIKPSTVQIDASNPYDDRVILDLVKKQMLAEPSVYFIDVFGSHPAYKERVSEEQKHFMNMTADTNKEEIINAYDDSILIMDNIIERTHKMATNHAKKTVRPFTIWYVSDHGQNLYADSSDWMGHPASREVHPNGYEVPFLILNKKNLPCGNVLPPVDEARLNLGRIFDFVLGSLCLLENKQ